MHLAPFLLQNCFAEQKYHWHLCNLVDIMKISLQFEITNEEIDALEEKIHIWVRLYEELVLLSFLLLYQNELI